MNKQAAQNQHYVPKFILRKFLANPHKERVNVFQKSTRKQFQTSIANIMAERRFNEFQIDENYYASFENAACRVEEAVLPAYEALIERKQLTGTPEECAMLGLFLAFQMLRTRAYRDHMQDMFQQIHDKFVGMGLEHEEIAELGNLTENDATKNHLKSLRDSISQFSSIISEKDFFLVEAPKGHCFYLADNPVTLHNDIKHVGFGGNLGLSVTGIQIYVPLSSKYMLAAYCPSILADFRKKSTEQKLLMRQIKASSVLAAAPLTGQRRLEFTEQVSALQLGMDRIDRFITATTEGTPLTATAENMDFYNAMQVGSARDFVVCEHGKFDLAKRFVKENGSTNGGLRMNVG